MTADPYAAATVQEFRDYAKIPSAAEDLELEPVIGAATRVAETSRECGIGPIIKRDFTRRVDVADGRAWWPLSPAVEVKTFVGVRGARTYLAAELDLDPDIGLIRAADGGWLDSGTYDATVTVGRVATVADVEPDHKEGVLVIAKHLWETRRGRGRGGALAAGTPPEELIPAGFLVPHRAKSLLIGSRKWVALA